MHVKRTLDMALQIETMFRAFVHAGQLPPEDFATRSSYGQNY